MAMTYLRRPAPDNSSRSLSARSRKAPAGPTAAPPPPTTGPTLCSSTTDVTELGFHVGRFEVKTTGALGFPNMVNPTLENPNAVVTADVCARPKTPAGQTGLADWTVGISRSIYEDYSLYSFDKSEVSKRFSEAAPDGAIDVRPGMHGLPFDTGIGRHGGAISASLLDRKPSRLEVVDSPNMEVPLTHDICEVDNRIKAVSRRMDFSVFLMARNDLSQEVHTLRHISYQQISQVRFSDLGGRKKADLGDDQHIVEGRVAKTYAHGRVLVGAQGTGEGPRPPVLGGSFANDIEEPQIIREKLGC
ncbi:hypothetical protein [Enhygromyxa salina]|uniref:Uncharacterized protein n=1 Tax=Enhygromyxa salina TaxID=215803 RepID=A0A2S9YSZ8_9BACT|nr:hypothetical protein [Enhygromyxa salina]PRQ08169.1 hypothetical protein ENSA7_21410 [Enhygromyxa salina]